MNDDQIQLPPEFRSANEIPVERATIKRERMIEILRKAVESDRQQRTIPEGWKLVPIEPTQEMGVAGKHYLENNEELSYRIIADNLYSVMLSYAPKPEQKK